MAVLNKIDAEQTSRLRSVAADVLYDTFSTSGSGAGLQTVSALVQNAYGIDDTRLLVEQGHLGWKVVDDTFATWFHWPLAM